MLVGAISVNNAMNRRVGSRGTGQFLMARGTLASPDHALHIEILL